MTRFLGSLSLVACFSLLCCHTSEQGASLDSGARESSESSVDSGPEDAALDSAGRDASANGCSGTLANPGTFSIASVCAQAYWPLNVIEYVMPCEGSIFVRAPSGPDCQNYWVLDAASGSIEAEAGTCQGGSVSWTCIPGFVLPSACLWTGPQKQLCLDAGSEAGSDAPEPNDGAGE